MAKRRKKLNKRVVIVLCVVLGLALAAGAVLVILSMPKDPQPFIERGDQAFTADDFGTAAREYSRAINYGSQDAEVFLRTAQAFLELVDDTELPRVKRAEYYNSGVKRVNQALQIDPELLEAQQLKTDLVWRSSVVGAGFRNESPDWQGYLDEATKLIALDPENAEAYFRRGLAHRGLMHRKEGNHEELARADFARAVELEPENVTYLVQGQIALLEQADKPEEARSAYEAALEKNPDSVQLRVRLASLLYRTQDKAESLDQLQMAIEIAQDLEPADQLAAQLALGDYYHMEGQVDEAMQAYETAESIEPTDFRAYVVHVFLLKVQGRYAEATGVMRKAMAAAEAMLADESAELTGAQRDALAEALIDLRYRIADSLLDEITGGMIVDREARAALVQEASDQLQIIDSEQDIRPIEPRYYKLMGRIALVENRLDEARTHLLKAYGDIKAGGAYDEHSARLLIAMYERQDRLTDAEEIIDEYLARPNLPNRANVMLAKAKLLMKYHEYGDAERIVQSVLAIREDYGPAILLQRQLEFETGSLRIDLLPGDAELTPRQIDVAVRMASRMWVSGERDEALRQMEELHRRMPKNLYVIRRLGQMYLIEERKGDAEALLIDAVEAYPENDDLKFDLELMREESPARRYQMRLERAEQIEDPLERALSLASVSAFSAGVNRDKETITYLRTAAEINPMASDCLEQLFGLAIRQRNTEHADFALEQAQWAVELATAENLDGFDGRLYEARLAAAQDKVPEAVNVLKGILRDRPLARRPSMLLGKCYAYLEDYDRAINTFMTIYEADRSYATVAIEIMNLMIMRGTIYETEEWIERAYRLAPYNPVVKNQYLRLQESKGEGDIDEFIANRERMHRSNPNDLQNRVWLARLYERADRLPEAEAMYRSIYRDSLDTIMGATVLVDYYDRTNQPAPVDQIISSLFDNVDDRALVYILWGRFYGPRSEKRGLAIYDEAITEDPSDTRTYDAKASLLARYGRSAEAADTMAEALEILKSDPENDEALALRFTKTMVRYRIDAGQLDIADELIAELQAERPEDSEITTFVGIVAARRGDHDQALEVFDSVIDADPKYVAARVERARLYIIGGEFSRAQDDLQVANEEGGTTSEITMQLGGVYERMQDRVSAQRTYEDLLNRDPSYEPAIRRLMELYYQVESWTLLDGLLEDVHRRFPNEPLYYDFEADMWQRRGNIEKRLAALRAGAGAAPNDQGTVGNYLVALVATSRYGEALSVVDRYIDRENFGPWVKATKAHIYVRQGKQAEAEALFAEAVAEATRDSLDEVGQQMRGAYGPAQAVTRLADMFDLRPDDWHIRALVGGMYRDAGQSQVALEMLTEASQLTDDPDDLVNVYTALGVTYYMLGDFRKAEVDYLRAIELDISDATVKVAALNNLAYMYADNLDELEKAEEYARQAAELAPNDANVLDTYGWTLARLKRYDDAVRYLNRSVSLSPLAAALYHLGYVFEQTGQPYRAKQRYQDTQATLTEERDTDNPLYTQAQAGIDRLTALEAPED